MAGPAYTPTQAHCACQTGALHPEPLLVHFLSPNLKSWLHCTSQGKRNREPGSPFVLGPGRGPFPVHVRDKATGPTKTLPLSSAAQTKQHFQSRRKRRATVSVPRRPGVPGLPQPGAGREDSRVTGPGGTRTPPRRAQLRHGQPHKKHERAREFLSRPESPTKARFSALRVGEVGRANHDRKGAGMGFKKKA